MVFALRIYMHAYKWVGEQNVYLEKSILMRDMLFLLFFILCIIFILWHKVERFIDNKMFH